MKRCPACDLDKAEPSFIGANCGDCHARGKDLRVQEETVGALKKVECEWCHKLRSNIYQHRKVCKSRPAGPPALPEAKRRKAGRKQKGADGDGRTAAKPNKCPFCHPGPNAALERDLITEAVRAGMRVDVACDFVRRTLLVALGVPS